MIIRLAALIIIAGFMRVNAQPYALAEDYVPVLNTYDFFLVFGGSDGNSVKLKDGLIAEMEFIALPGTSFKVHEVIEFEDRNLKYYRVTTEDYDYEGNFYVDSRMVKPLFEPPAKRRKFVPKKEDMITELKRLEGYPYMWGGNCADGIEDMLRLYKPKGDITAATKELWTLKGVDCSGLLYQVSNGCTPRNTSSLATFGKTVDIEGKTTEEIIAALRPLDLIVLKGHVIIVLDGNNVIESSPVTGVHRTEIRVRLEKLLESLSPANEFSKTGKVFVARRWD